jgi:enterochelin esterase family protein
VSVEGAAGAPAVELPTRRLAINRLKERKPVDAVAVDRFLARYPVPIVEGARCTFLFRGEVDEVWLVQRILGLPDRLPMRRIRGTDLWYLVLELPRARGSSTRSRSAAATRTTGSTTR